MDNVFYYGKVHQHIKQWEGYILLASNHRQFLVPRGFAYGFLILTEFEKDNPFVMVKFKRGHDGNI